MNDSSVGSDRRSSVWRSYKVYLFIATWLVALVATDPSLGLLPLIYMFPLGLAGFINRHLGNDGGWWVLGAFTAVYVVHGFFYFRSHNRIVTWSLFAILVLLLTCNVQGCHEMQYRH